MKTPFDHEQSAAKSENSGEQKKIATMWSYSADDKISLKFWLVCPAGN